MAKIKEVAKALFQRLQPKRDEFKLVNEWVAKNSDSNNLPIFLTKASEEDQQRLCVMLKKALDHDDFSAFKASPPSEDKPEAEEDQAPDDLRCYPDPAPAPEEPKDTEPEEPKAEPKKPVAKATAKVTEPTQSTDGAPIDAMIRTVAGAMATRKINEAIEKGLIGKGGDTPAESVSEDRIREIIQEEVKDLKKEILKSLSALL